MELFFDCLYLVKHHLKCGLVVDMFKNLPIATYLLILSSAFTACAYAWLAIPPAWTKIPMPAILSFAFGYGFAPHMFCMDHEEGC